MSIGEHPVPLGEREQATVAAAGLLVAPWDEVEGRLSEFRRRRRAFAGLISWRNPPGFFDELAVPPRRDMPHLVLSAWDVEEDGDPDAPALGQVRRGLDFARRHGEPLLINCVAGVSRSTAMALAILCDRLGPGREREAVERLFAVRPQAVPNLLILRHAEALLDREGRLTEAVLAEPELRARREGVGRPGPGPGV